MEQVSVKRLLMWHSFCSGRFPYIFGAKPNFNTLPKDIDGSDCSGYVRYLFYHATMGTKIPEGSYQQYEFFRRILVPVDYTVHHDSELIAFHFPTATHSGHVWYCIHGMTVECYGGHGPGRRQWNTNMEGIPANEFCDVAYLLPCSENVL